MSVIASIRQFQAVEPGHIIQFDRNSDGSLEVWTEETDASGRIVRRMQMQLTAETHKTLIGWFASADDEGVWRLVVKPSPSAASPRS